MAQFMVYQNKNSTTKKAVPLLLDIQSDLLQDLKTTVVIPLYHSEAHRDKALTRLIPSLKIDGKEYLAFTTHLAGISRKELGKEAASAKHYRNEIIAAIDFMLIGAWAATRAIMAIKNGMRPIHSGEVLKEDVLNPLGMSINALAQALDMTTTRLSEIVRGRRGVTPDTALRLARYFGGDARSWLNLQTAYDLRVAEIGSAKEISKAIKPMKRSKAVWST